MHPEHPLPDEVIAPEPTLSPTSRPRALRERIALIWFRILTRVNVSVMTVYAGAIALVGIEGFAVVLTFTSVWPVAVPFFIGLLALVYFARERIIGRWRRRPGRSARP